MSVALAEGDILAGKYRVERVLGRGGMGVVLAATHLQLNQRVAIKLLLAGATADVTERFLREARAAVRLKTEHVARVIDVGELPDGAPYMVMEYLDGQDLSQRVRTGGVLPVPDAVEYLLHGCEAIAEAHALGIIHRDLKPANLFLTHAADGTHTVKVLDFGISKATTAADADEGEGMALTKTTAVLGSPLYMSPEQMKSARQADARSDIWSLGAILYELLTGSVPFNATTYAELVLMVNMNEPPPMAERRPDVPPELEAAVLRCLEKKPDARFQNVAELAWAIAPFAPPYAQVSAERAARTLGMGGPQSMRGTHSMRGTQSTSMGGSVPSPPLVAQSLTAVSAGNTSGGSAPAAAPAGRGKAVAIIGGAAAIGVVVTLLAFGRPAPQAAVPPASSEVKAAAPTSAQPVATAAVTVTPAATAEPTPSASASASASAVASATATAAPSAPRPGAGRPVPAATGAAPAPAPAAGKKNPLEINLK